MVAVNPIELSPTHLYAARCILSLKHSLPRITVGLGTDGRRPTSLKRRMEDPCQLSIPIPPNCLKLVETVKSSKLERSAISPAPDGYVFLHEVSNDAIITYSVVLLWELDCVESLAIGSRGPNSLRAN